MFRVPCMGPCRTGSHYSGSCNGRCCSPGLGAMGYVGYVYADLAFYQAYQNWAFDEQLHGRTPGVAGFLADVTPLRRFLRRSVVVEEEQEARVRRAGPRQQLASFSSGPSSAGSNCRGWDCARWCARVSTTGRCGGLWATYRRHRCRVSLGTWV